MSLRSGSAAIQWAVRLVFCLALVSSGCKWQRDTYTARMLRTLGNWEKEAELARLVGDGYQPPGEFALWIRPPKPTVPVRQPEDPPPYLALFQGGEPLVEVVIIGSAGTESLSDFEKAAMATLTTTQRGPGVDYQKQEPIVVPSLHGGEATFESFTAQAQRQAAGAAGQPASAVAYDWLLCFAEETPQKVMVAFIVPDSKYTDFGPAMTKTLQSLALSSKIGIAQQSGGGGAAAAAAPAGGSPPPGQAF